VVSSYILREAGVKKNNCPENEISNILASGTAILLSLPDQN
jgi:hypothetical protein